jgi:hypothetical protein
MKSAPILKPAMPGVATSAQLATTAGRAPRKLSLAGAGALIAVGYMDPGNWATALAGGASYGYALLGVVALASLLGLLLQWLAARVGLVSGRDLAQLARERYSHRTALALWLASEIAIVACDVPKWSVARSPCNCCWAFRWAAACCSRGSAPLRCWRSSARARARSRTPWRC